MLIRLEALELAAIAGDSDASDRHALNFLQVTSEGVVSACDGSVALRIRAAAMEPTLFDALLEKDEQRFEGEIFVDAGDARDFKAACRKAIKRAGSKQEGVHVGIARDGDDLTMATADGITTRRFITTQKGDAVKWPDLSRVIPASRPTSIAFDVDRLIGILKTLKKLKCKGVILSLDPADTGLSVRVEATSLIGDIDGVVMPMRLEDATKAPDSNGEPAGAEPDPDDDADDDGDDE